LDKVIDFLTRKYIEPQYRRNITDTVGIDFIDTEELKKPDVELVSFDIDKGEVVIEQYNSNSYPAPGKKAFINGKPAPTGKYKFGFIWYVHIEDGFVTKVTFL